MATGRRRGNVFWPNNAVSRFINSNCPTSTLFHQLYISWNLYKSLYLQSQKSNNPNARIHVENPNPSQLFIYEMVTTHFSYFCVGNNCQQRIRRHPNQLPHQQYKAEFTIFTLSDEKVVRQRVKNFCWGLFWSEDPAFDQPKLN